MIIYVALYQDQAPIVARNPGDLDGTLRIAMEEAHRRNILSNILVRAENGNSITIVIGGDETVLGFIFAHGKPPYYASKGTTEQDEPVLTCYGMFEHRTEFPRKFVIPISNGVAAVKEFADSGELPTCIGWREV